MIRAVGWLIIIIFVIVMVTPERYTEIRNQIISAISGAINWLWRL